MKTYVVLLREINVGGKNKVPMAEHEYLFENDEAFHVIEGAATVELSKTGESVDLQAGDIAYFSAGTSSVWTITELFRKLTVIAC